MAFSRVVRVSRLETFGYLLGQALPNYLQGLFTRRRWWVGLWSRVHPDPAGLRLIGRLRRKYNSGYLYLPTLRSGLLLVVDPEGVGRVLDRSPEFYAEPPAKRRGMGSFQPDAVAISRGAAWRERRRFNEAVLDTAMPLHRHADRFLVVAREETARILPRDGGLLTWSDFEPLFEKLALRIIFGDGARDDDMLMGDLKNLMRRGNRLFALRRSSRFDRFYQRLRSYLENPPAGSLVSCFEQAAPTDVTRAENQVPHWMFAMNETLATNAVRALALLAAHPDAAREARREMAAADLDDARQVADLKHLEGCFQEAMRLWPTTPVLGREVIRQDILGGEAIAPGTQVLLPLGFIHRDRRTHIFADAFRPHVWRDGAHARCFHHLSNGPQACPGQGLAEFLAQAVLASLLGGYDYTLQKPALRGGGPLPCVFNVLDVRLKAEPRAEAT